MSHSKGKCESFGGGMAITENEQDYQLVKDSQCCRERFDTFYLMSVVSRCDEEEQSQPGVAEVH